MGVGEGGCTEQVGDEPELALAVQKISAPLSVT